MDSSIRDQLDTLKMTVENTSRSTVPLWLRETLAETVSGMLQDDVSDFHVVNKLIGGLRAIGDVLSLSDDDIIISQMVSIIDQVQHGNLNP